MHKVKIEKDRLLETLEANEKAHKADFEIAFDAFTQKAIENLESRLRTLRSGRKIRQEDLWVNLEVPVDHSEDYERAIEMLSWEVEDEVYLTEQEFRQYVQDKWGWSAKFTTNNQFYTGSATPSKV